MMNNCLNPMLDCHESHESNLRICLQWFKGGKTNICYNAVDRSVEAGDGEKIAMYWEGNEPGQDAKLTYSELLNKVCQVKITRAPIVDTPKHLHVMPPWRRIK